MGNTINIPASFQNEGVQLKDWTDWRWQLANTIRGSEKLVRYLSISKERSYEINKIITSDYQNGRDEMRLTPYLVSLINANDPNDPIALQHLPQPQELEEDDFDFGNVWEKPEDFLDGENRLLQQKYPDIALIRLSNTCHSFCRFCFEKERTLRHGVATNAGPEEFSKAVSLITKDKRIRTILLSGGDPLIVPDEILKERLEALSSILHLKTIRINTRALLHNPFRITPEFANMLGEIQKNSWDVKPAGTEIRMGVHFNHPHELTEEATAAVRTLQKSGIQVYNQTVLLKGINDSAEIIQTLFRRLREEGVVLHYFSHAMIVPRTGHLRTTVRKGQEIVRSLRQSKEFRAQLPYYELSHPTGKQLIPDSMSEYFFEDTIEKNGKQIPVIKFLSDITGRWEVWVDGK